MLSKVAHILQPAISNEFRTVVIDNLKNPFSFIGNTEKSQLTFFKNVIGSTTDQIQTWTTHKVYL